VPAIPFRDSATGGESGSRLAQFLGEGPVDLPDFRFPDRLFRLFWFRKTKKNEEQET